MIVTDDDQARRSVPIPSQPRTCAENIERSGTTGMVLEHNTLGYNYRMSELNAALGVAQITRLTDILEQRSLVAEFYINRLIENPDVILPTISPETSRRAGSSSSCVSPISTRARSATASSPACTDMTSAPPPTSRASTSSRTTATPSALQKATSPSPNPISERTLALPFYNRLDDTQIELICHTLHVMLQREKLLRD